MREGMFDRISNVRRGRGQQLKQPKLSQLQIYNGRRTQARRKVAQGAMLAVALRWLRVLRFAVIVFRCTAARMRAGALRPWQRDPAALVAGQHDIQPDCLEENQENAQAATQHGGETVILTAIAVNAYSRCGE
jgi:hypothetical protein